MIKKRKLGKTKLDVSEIGLGGWQLGAPVQINNEPGTVFGGLDQDTVRNIIDTALELGINTFDTADVYSLGDSEIRLGNLLKEYRSDINIFTKAGNVPGFPTWSTDYSYNHLIAAINRSLTRLQTDYVDVFQIHNPPNNEQDYSTIEKAFNKIKSEGKARYCGISIGIHYDKGIEIIEKGLVDCLQLYFTLIDPKPLEDLLPLAKKNNIGIIIAEPLAQGFLTNKYKPGHIFPHDDVRSHTYPPELLQMKLERSKQFEFLQNDNRSLSQVALAYILSRDEISTCIPGVKSSKQLTSNVAASKINLNSNELAQIKSIQSNWNEGISRTG